MENKITESKDSINGFNSRVKHGWRNDWVTESWGKYYPECSTAKQTNVEDEREVEKRKDRIRYKIFSRNPRRKERE